MIVAILVVQLSVAVSVQVKVDVGGMLVQLVAAENKIVVVYGIMVVIVPEVVWTTVLVERVDLDATYLVMQHV